MIQSTRFILLAVLWLIPYISAAQKTYTIQSPNGKLKTEISVGSHLSFTVNSGENRIFEVKDIFMDTDRGMIPSLNPKVKRAAKRSVDEIVVPVIKEKNASIKDRYNELTIEFADKSAVIFRLFDEGVAYRLKNSDKGEITVNNEHAEFIFDPMSEYTFQRDKNMHSSSEAVYVTKRMDSLNNDDWGNLPALVKTPSGTNVVFLESDTKKYPVMWLKKGENNLETHFWPYPKTYNTSGNSYNKLNIATCEEFIAKTDADREFPWRIFTVSTDDKGLIGNQLVYLLAPECKLDDVSWIKPGWVMFDWWARRGVYGVDFKGGINTETAKYMIDFAADYGIRYFLFDDGWTMNDDLTQMTPDVDIKEVVKYADSKGVDVMLWVAYSLFDEQMDKALKQFSEWGIKGIKIDFMNRSDQVVTDFYRRAAKECAEHKIVIDFHGAYRPDGLRREYPNVLTREGLLEFEYNGCDSNDNPDHHCTLPFVRNVAGPADYIPGTMFNSTRKTFRIYPETPMGQGTRAHSIALALIMESPMQMLSDPPSDYYREHECTKFLTSIPVEWDETLPIDGKVGDYITIARRSGDTWYVGAITDWTPRSQTLILDFLDSGTTYEMESLKDGVNADTRANDYKREVREVRKGDKIDISMASGGGWVAAFRKK